MRRPRSRIWLPSDFGGLAGSIIPEPGLLTLSGSLILAAGDKYVPANTYTRVGPGWEVSYDTSVLRNGRAAIRTAQAGVEAFCGLRSLTGGCAPGVQEHSITIFGNLLGITTSSSGNAGCATMGTGGGHCSTIGTRTSDSTTWWAGGSQEFTTLTPFDTGFHAYQLVMNGSGDRAVYEDGTLISRGLSSGTPFAFAGAESSSMGLYNPLFSLLSQTTQDARIWAAYFGTSVPTFGDRMRLLGYEFSQLGYSPPTEILILGDSVSVGHVLEGQIDEISTTNYAEQLALVLAGEGITPRFDNLAEGGQKIEHFLPLAAGGVAGPDILEKAGARQNICLLCTGINDVNHELAGTIDTPTKLAAVAATMAATQRDVVAGLHTYGWTVVLMTIPPLGLDPGSTFATLRASYNALVLAGASRADYVFDSEAELTGHYFTPDLTHCDDASYVYWGGRIRLFLSTKRMIA